MFSHRTDEDVRTALRVAQLVVETLDVFDQARLKEIVEALVEAGETVGLQDSVVSQKAFQVLKAGELELRLRLVSVAQGPEREDVVAVWYGTRTGLTAANTLSDPQISRESLWRDNAFKSAGEALRAAGSGSHAAEVRRVSCAFFSLDDSWAGFDELLESKWSLRRRVETTDSLF